jgi:hypothetical protein
MLFKCRVCSEKDTRILDLKEQIAYLKSQLNSPNDPEHPPQISLEADGVLSGQQHIIDISGPAIVEEALARQVIEDEYERQKLFAGTY